MFRSRYLVQRSTLMATLQRPCPSRSNLTQSNLVLQSNLVRPYLLQSNLARPYLLQSRLALALSNLTNRTLTNRTRSNLALNLALTNRTRLTARCRPRLLHALNGVINEFRNSQFATSADFAVGDGPECFSEYSCGSRGRIFIGNYLGRAWPPFQMPVISTFRIARRFLHFPFV